MSKEKQAEERVLARMRGDAAWLVRRGLSRWNYCCGGVECISGRGVHAATVTRLLGRGLLRLSADRNEAHLAVSAEEQMAALKEE